METSQSIKVGDWVRLRGTNVDGVKLFVGESDLSSCVGWVFVVKDVAKLPLDYPLFCRVHPLYADAAPLPIRNGISLKYEEVELVE